MRDDATAAMIQGGLLDGVLEEDEVWSDVEEAAGFVRLEALG